jgi:hypothetical protein
MVAEYLEEVSARKGKKTFASYALTLRLFLSSFQKPYIEGRGGVFLNLTEEQYPKLK